MPRCAARSGFLRLFVLLLIGGTASGASLVKGSVTRTENNGCQETYSNRFFTATTANVVVLLFADYSISGAALTGGPAIALPPQIAGDQRRLYQVFTGLTPGLVYTVNADQCTGIPFSNTSIQFEVYEFLCPGGPSLPLPDPQVPLVSWTLSASATDPFVNRSASPQSTLYLWLVCSPPEGVSVTKFRFNGGTITSRIFWSGALNAGSGNDFVIAFGGCLTPPALVATITLASPTSDAWLGPTLGLDAQMVSVACGSSELVCAQVVGFGTSVPRTSPNFCAGLPITQQIFWADPGVTKKIETSDVSGQS